MATFRCKPTITTHRFHAAMLVAATLSLACMARGGSPEAASASGAKIQRIEIEHVTPRPDAVGPQPTTLEWTAAAGADSYAVSVENEIELPIFDQEHIKTTSVPWPKEVKLEPGTYFWRIVGLKDNRVVADSGRAAFVVMER